MLRVVWLTDVHLNFLLAEGVRDFLAEVATARPDVVLLGGDIAESHNVTDYLGQMRDAWQVPIYFVLGNHDYYFGSIVETRRRVGEFCQQQSGLHYLTAEEVCRLAPQLALVGHDGWADGRAGDYPRSLVTMHDNTLIGELAAHDKQARWEILKALGDEAAAHIRRVLPLAFEQHREAWLLTHVPPFREACWYEGRLSDDDWSPHFTCQAAGQAILEYMGAHPGKRLTVLCGHTHGQGHAYPLRNVHVITGGAQYGRPTVTQVFEVE